MNRIVIETKVAIIMSVYRSDSLEHLKVAVASILAQSHNTFKLFIYRDGEVPREIDEYLVHLMHDDIKVNVITSNENYGLANALNNLIDIIMLDGSFEFIARMDSDDISRANRLSQQVRFMKENQSIDVCGTSCSEFGASFALDKKCLPETPEELINYSITHCPFIHPSVMFRTSVFQSGVRYPTDTSLTEDMALWFVLLNKGYRFANLNEVLLDYRLNEHTLERRRGGDKAVSEFKIRFKNMVKLKKVSLKNILLISVRLVFHLLPSSILKIAYKKLR